MVNQGDREELVMIHIEEYHQLCADSKKLRCLENAGVDNWDGYDYAMEEFHA